MRRKWAEQELVEHWTLSATELAWTKNRTDRGRLGFYAILKFFQIEGRFPKEHKEVPSVAVEYLAKQLDVSVNTFLEYDWQGRSEERDRGQIRSHLGFRKFSLEDFRNLDGWLRQDILFKDQELKHLEEAAREWCQKNRIEPPTPLRMERLMRSVVHRWESEFFTATFNKLPTETRRAIDALIDSSPEDTKAELSDGQHPEMMFSVLRRDPGRAGLKSVLAEIAKRRLIDHLALPHDLFVAVPSKVLEKYRRRAAAEPPRELRMHPDPIRYSLIAAFCWQRRQEITDGLVELLMQVIHRIVSGAEKKVVKTLIQDLRKVHGKTTLLYKLAEAAVEHPEGVIREVLYPIVDEQTLRDLVREYKSTGPAYQQQVHTVMRSSYGRHYRRMLPLILDTLEFHSNNERHRPVLDALALLKAKRESKQQYFSLEENVPIAGVVRSGWQELIIDTDKTGSKRINRIDYEMAVLHTLRDRLRCKEVWVAGANRFRNPDEDLPPDFADRRETYYQALRQSQDAEVFIAELQRTMAEALSLLDKGMPRQAKVKISQRGLTVSPLDPQPEPVNLEYLKAEVSRRWPMTNLLDVLKETDLRVGFSSEFKSVASREAMERGTLQKYLLLGLYGLGTNTGLKRISAGDPDIQYKDLLYVRRRFITKENLRHALVATANAIFAIRQPQIWGEGTTACASDSKKFGAWDQNLMTEWHIRYGGRGIMIYWHVERKAVCIYSQLKRCSSSEVAAMIEGVLRHCTDMTVEKNYVDSHGQSEVAFAFCHLLGFGLLPRLKALSRQKLYRPEAGNLEECPNLQPILTRPINWDLIRKQYDEMIKYTTALRLGTAEPEAILRRFTRGNLKHPTYQALAELGKARKTIFLCRYLHSEELRREVQEGLNIIENWNSTNDFIFYGKGREVASNRLEDQELSVLSLHLLQIALVYINTLMIQNVLADSQWLKRMEADDLRALTPLIYNHVNPYGTFKLDMEKRILLDREAVALS